MDPPQWIWRTRACGHLDSPTSLIVRIGALKAVGDLTEISPAPLTAARLLPWRTHES
ncbi:hypothetical protein AB0M20_11830 [Actinoplanes sp. NPDC051633]|uniref:hypothetical protein n=1 Tax=Actinoplanes sp. NPDC051633 TaxID=3155670 RepID=UPI0034262B84